MYSQVKYHWFNALRSKTCYHNEIHHLSLLPLKSSGRQALHRKDCRDNLWTQDVVPYVRIYLTKHLLENFNY